jgi:hypothetical protein
MSEYLLPVHADTAGPVGDGTFGIRELPRDGG